MDHRPLLKDLRQLLLLLGAASTVSGCALYKCRNVTLTIRDLSTDTPAAGIHVETFYGHGGMFNPPRKDEGITDERGQTILRMAEFDNMYSTHLYLDVTWPVDPPLRWPKHRRYLVLEDMVREGGTPIFEYGPEEDTRQLSLLLQPHK